MKTFSALLAICAGNSPVPGEFPGQRPVTRSFDVFFDLRLNKRLSKQSWSGWLATLSRPLWCHCNALLVHWTRFPTSWFVIMISTSTCKINSNYVFVEILFNILDHMSTIKMLPNLGNLSWENDEYEYDLEIHMTSLAAYLYINIHMHIVRL